MKILLVSTLKRRVGPDIFASRSRIIYQLARGLALRGHTVSLLGTGDSSIEGVTTIPVIDTGWVDQPPVENTFVRDSATLIKLAKQLVTLQSNFDIIHNHTYPDFFPHVIEDELTIPLVSTLHALHDTYMDDTLSQFTNSYFVSLSEAYAQLYKKTKFFRTVYNGVDTKLYAYAAEKQDYLFWLGRLPKAKNKDGTFMDPKGVRWAIKLAQQTESKLFLAGAVEDAAFFEQDVKPHLNEKIQWVGKVSSEQSVPAEKIVALMQGAKAFLMTINQQEPFGLVMAEAGSCGTPVIAFDRGSVAEVIIEGKTGFVVNPDEGESGLASAVARINTLRPLDCREHIEQHFSIEAMVRNYENTYKELISHHEKRTRTK
jgi:glycosyltransferase involved in cell wall biosynthesis